MRTTAKILAGFALALGTVFAGTAAASAGENQLADPMESPEDPCGEHGMVIPDFSWWG